MRYMNESLEWLSPQAWVHDGVQHPRSIFTIWTDAELVAVGIYRVMEGEIEPPEGKIFSRFDYAVDGTVVVGTPVYEDEPEPPVPQAIEGWQAEVVMRLFEVSQSVSLWDAVQAAIDQMADPAEQIVARTVLARGRLRRDSPLLAQMADEFSLSEEQVDGLFVQANGLEA